MRLNTITPHHLSSIPFYSQPVQVKSRRELRDAGYTTYSGLSAGSGPQPAAEVRAWGAAMALPTVRSSRWRGIYLGPLIATLARVPRLEALSGQYVFAWDALKDATNLMAALAQGTPYRPAHNVDNNKQFKDALPCSSNTAFAAGLCADAFAPYLAHAGTPFPSLISAPNPYMASEKQIRTLYWPAWAPLPALPGEYPWQRVEAASGRQWAPQIAAQDKALTTEALYLAVEVARAVVSFFRREPRAFTRLLNAYSHFYAALCAVEYGPKMQGEASYSTMVQFAPLAVMSVKDMLASALVKVSAHAAKFVADHSAAIVMGQFKARLAKVRKLNSAERRRYLYQQAHWRDALKEAGTVHRAAKKALKRARRTDTGVSEAEERVRSALNELECVKRQKLSTFPLTPAEEELVAAAQEALDKITL